MLTCECSERNLKAGCNTCVYCYPQNYRTVNFLPAQSCGLALRKSLTQNFHIRRSVRCVHAFQPIKLRFIVIPMIVSGSLVSISKRISKH